MNSSTPLEAPEVRVLGTLLEKEATTPEVYPLTLNSLVLGCNQKSNRDPVVAYDAETVEESIEALRARGFVSIITGNGRTTKYAQRISETLNLGRRESAIVCVLLLRGPQTLGEIKDRAERLFRFNDLPEVELVLEKLFSEQLAVRMARQPGQKEARFSHLLAGEPVAVAGDNDAPVAAPSRVSQLEADLSALRSEFDELKSRFETLEAQLR